MAYKQPTRRPRANARSWQPNILGIHVDADRTWYCDGYVAIRGKPGNRKVHTSKPIPDGFIDEQLAAAVVRLVPVGVSIDLPHYFPDLPAEQSLVVVQCFGPRRDQARVLVNRDKLDYACGDLRGELTFRMGEDASYLATPGDERTRKTNDQRPVVVYDGTGEPRAMVMPLLHQKSLEIGRLARKLEAAGG